MTGMNRAAAALRSSGRRRTVGALVALAIGLSLAVAACQPAIPGFLGASGGPAIQAAPQVAVPAKAQPVQATARLPLPEVASPVGDRPATTVQYTIEAKEVIALLDDGVSYDFWTFGGTIPGPMLRVRQGDTVEITLKNAPDSKAHHSIDLHAVTGPGGGARATDVAPGESARFSFRALNPGVYVYHCAMAPVAYHIANGMYGMIVVEPPGGLTKVDHEFYVMQGEVYTDGKTGDKGHHAMNFDKLTDERPDYVLFDGSVGSLSGDRALKSKVGDTVRIFFGNGGPNLPSSFHMIGEIFDRVHPEGASEVETNVQTTLVPPGGATMVELKTDYPGNYVLVDHALGRLMKGASGSLMVEGAANPDVFQADKDLPMAGH